MIASGMRLGPYVISAPIGAGGMGEIYRAHHVGLTRDSLKVLLKGFESDARRLARFMCEETLFAKLAVRRHPRWVVYGSSVDQAANSPYRPVE